MRKLRWFEADDPAAPLDWRAVSLILATLFLNYPFWLLTDLPMFFPLPVYACLMAAGSVAITALFFLGPALASQRANQPLTEVIKNSFGTIPALGIRIASVVLLIICISRMLSFGLGWLRVYYDDYLTLIQGTIAGAVTLLLIVTSGQGPATSSKLGRFSCKLGVAILIVALLRVREGWPFVMKGISPEGYAMLPSLGRGFGILCFYFGPLLMFAANFGYRLREPKRVVIAASVGITLPLFGTTLLVGIIDLATAHSPLYMPGLPQNVGVALISLVRERASRPRMMLLMVTLFGALRFALNEVQQLSCIPRLKGLWRAIALGCLTSAVAWSTAHADRENLGIAMQISAALVIATAAILTADSILPPSKFNWLSLVALATGASTSLWLPLPHDWHADQWLDPYLFPTYATAFLVCLLGRAISYAL